MELTVGTRIRVLEDRYWEDEHGEDIPAGTCGTVTRVYDGASSFDWRMDDGTDVFCCWPGNLEDGVFEIVEDDSYLGQLTRILTGE